MWRSDWGNIRALQEQVESASMQAAAEARERHRLSSQLSKLQGDLSQRIDQLARAFDAFVELSQLRDELVLHADARRWRLAARRLVEGRIAHTVVPAAGGTLPTVDVAGYWLAPAVRGLPDVIEGGAGSDALDEAAARDELRTATFVVAAAPLLGAPGLAERWLPMAMAADGPETVTHAERAIWLAAADGALPPGALAAVGDALAARIAHAGASGFADALAANPPVSTSTIAPADRSAADGALDRWARHVATVADAPAGSHQDADEQLLGVVRSLVEEGSAEERPLLDRAEELRRVIDHDAAGGLQDWDERAGTIVDLLVADAADVAHPGRARLALTLLRVPLLTAADALVAEASVPPSDEASVRVGDRTIRITDAGADPAELAAAAAFEPTPKRLGVVALAGGGAAIVVSIVLALADGLGWLILGLAGAAVIGAMWLSDRANADRDVLAVQDSRQAADAAVAQGVEQLAQRRRDAVTAAERTVAARARLAASLEALARPAGEEPPPAG